MIEFLEAHDIECDYADNGNLGLALALEQPFDVIVLDIMLPGKNGMALCKEIRNAGQSTPILMLTARDALEDKLQGFDAGADDYLVKPFDLPELVARLHALRRRSGSNTQRLKVGDLEMDHELRQITRNGQLLELHRVGWLLLDALLRASPKVLSRQELEQLIWPDELPDSDALKSHIYKLRQVVDKPFDTPLIHTVRGVGLVLKCDETSSEYEE